MDEEGTITALSIGETNVIAVTVDGGFTQRVEVKVVAPGPLLSAIEVYPSKTIYKVNEKFTFKGRIIARYSNGSNKDISINDPMLIIEPVDTSKEGSVTVNIYYTEGPYTRKTSYLINVKNGGGCSNTIVTSSSLITLISLIAIGLIIKRKTYIKK